MKRKNMIIFLLLAALCLQLAACGVPSAPTEPKQTENTQGTDKPQPSTEQQEPVQPSGQGNGEAKPVDASFEAASADFAARLLQNAVSSEENTVLSPYSLLMALAMTANGASGETRSQMETLFGLPLEQLNGYLLACAQKNSEEFSAANAIWVREDFEISEEFRQINQNYYGAEIQAAAFDDKTCKRINEWVSTQTKGRIREILNEMNPDALMYLVNALAFTARWKFEYDTSDVIKDTFHGANGDKTAELMHSEERWYLHDENTTGFLKDYKNDRFCYAVLLPKEGVSLNEYIAALSGEKLTALIAGAEQTRIRAAMPKFKTEYSGEMNNALRQMGMSDALDPNLADFSAMSQAGEKGLYISQILHRTFLQVNETGTEAAAATAVEMSGSTAVENYKTVRVDRPFVCGIYDRELQTFLFLGAIYNV